MNRRDLLSAGAVLGASAILPLPATASPSLVTWVKDAKKSPHAALVGDWIASRLEDGEVYVSTTLRLVDHYLILDQPRFVVEETSSVWNFMDGRRPEPGLKITIWAQGHQVDGAEVASTFDSHIIPAEKQGYIVRSPRIEWDRKHDLEEAGVRFRDCMRWLEDLKADRESLKGTVTGRAVHITSNA